MSETQLFIKNIDIKKVRHLENLHIEMDSERPRHLILTGPNGCGKTSILLAIKNYLNGVPSNLLIQVETWRNAIDSMVSAIAERRQLLLNSQSTEQQKAQWTGEIANFEQTVNQYKRQLEEFEQVTPVLSSLPKLVEAYRGGKFIIAYFGPKRFTQMNPVMGVVRVDLPTVSPLESDLSRNFLQFLVNQENKAGMSYYRKDISTYNQISEWKEKFIKRLKLLFNSPDLELQYDIDKFDFTIKTPNREPFGFNTLSDGFSSAIQIIAELILRMESASSGAYDLPGIVLIDEIETHLHIELQKQILPFLCDFFPKLQFIVTSHSPFVLTSLTDSVIFDLQSLKRWENVSYLPASILIEDYFDSNQYSTTIETKINKYKELLNTKTKENADQISMIEKELDRIPYDCAPELVTEYQYLKAKEQKG